MAAAAFEVYTMAADVVTVSVRSCHEFKRN